MPLRPALLALIASLVGQGMFAQSTASLVVITTEATTGASLPFADVSIASLRKERLADRDGVARFTGLATGRVEVRVRRVGFIPLRQSITLSGTDTLRAALQRLSFTLPPVVTKDAVCPGRPVGDTATLAIIEQMRINADRARMMSEQFAFSSQVERVLSYQGMAGRGIDTLTVSGEIRWRYAPGKLVVRAPDSRDPSAEQLLIPQLVHFASDEFLAHHCFRYVGPKELDGVQRARIDYEPIRTLKDPDVAGSLFLDTLTHRLVAMTMEMDRPVNAAVQRKIRVETRYVDILPGIPIAQQTCAATRFWVAPPGNAPPNAYEGQRLLGVDFPAGAPGSGTGVAAGATCRR
jgi:hypothetical protein